MEIIEKKTIEIKRDIPVPSYWKSDNGYYTYRLYQRGEKYLCDRISHYPNIGKHGLSLNDPVTDIDYNTAIQITKEQFGEVWANFIDQMDIIINEEDKSCGSDSFWILRKQMLPTNPEKE